MDMSIHGQEDEISFWRDAIERFKLDPSQSSIGGKLDPMRPLQPVIVDRVRVATKDDNRIAKVLDVGCGPLSTIGKTDENVAINLVGLDPLADAYQELLKEADIERPHETVTGVAETASDLFGEGFFDYVHAENSLDHCQDAALALLQLQKVCRPDGIFFFRVFVNEGEHNHYSGMHQWNFDTYNGRVIFWRPGEIHFLDEIFDLPMRFWYTDETFGPKATRRKFLNCEVFNCDLAHGFSRVGSVHVRYLPRYSSFVLKRGDDYNQEARAFAHFGFEDKAREEASLVWPAAQPTYVLKLPEGPVKRVKLGQFTRHQAETGALELKESWSSFLPMQELAELEESTI